MFKCPTKIVLTIGFVVQCLVACSSPHVQAGQHGEQQFNDKSLLWEVTSATGAHSYVFGTTHVSDSLMFMQRDTVLELLDNAKDFYAEIDLDSAMGAGTLVAMASKLMLPPGTTLDDIYTPEQMARLKPVLEKRLGAMAPMAMNLKPGALIGILMMDTLPDTAPMSIDEFLWKRASTHGTPCHGIERVDEQLAILDAMPAHLLLEAIDDDTTSDEMLQHLLDAYAREDLGSIVALVDSLSGAESFMLQINDERNVRMAKRLRAALDKGGAFIAVGTAHLGGTQGLLAELSRAGYVVRPVMGGRRVQWLRWD